MHAGVVHLVGAGERDQDLDEREPELLRLESEQLATDTVHADAVVRVGDGRDQRTWVAAELRAQREQGQG